MMAEETGDYRILVRKLWRMEASIHVGEGFENLGKMSFSLLINFAATGLRKPQSTIPNIMCGVRWCMRLQ